MKRKGFTLIELLVVIAIIGILAAMVLVALGGARAKARDAQRKSDLRNIKAALELYYADQKPNGYLSVATATTVSSAILGDSASTYMKTVPADPQPLDDGYTYATDGTDPAIASANYGLAVALENKNDSEGVSVAPAEAARAAAYAGATAEGYKVLVVGND